MKNQKYRWLNCAQVVLVAALMKVMLALPGVVHAASLPLPNEVMVNGVEFVLIPEGWFYKSGGIPKAGDEREFQLATGNGHVKIWLDGFYIAKFEARARDLVKYLNSDAGKLEDYAGANISCSARRDDHGKFVQLKPDEDLPATHMSWEMADRWSRWMGFRLASEMEWEKAARGTDQRHYPWGDQYPDETYAGFNVWSDCFTWPVNSFKKGRSPYGIYNMAGNVREFVADWYNADYDASLRDGARNPPLPEKGTVRDHEAEKASSGPWKMVKGGRWGSKEEQLLIGGRVYPLPDDPFRCNGTRFALDVTIVLEHLANGRATVIVQ